jgi:malate dehydrogenase (oxaloacetate-decarboxylating)(NADP+)
VDSRGLAVKDRANLGGHKLRYAHDEQAPIGDFLTAIKTLRPTAIIGVAAVGGAFTPDVLRTMAESTAAVAVVASRDEAGHKSVAEAHRGCQIQGHHRRHPIA